MASAAASDGDVILLSVKLADPQQRRSRRLRQGKDAGIAAGTKQKVKQDTEVAFALRLRDLAVQRLAFAEKQWQKAIEKGDLEGAKEWEKKVEKAEEKVNEAKAEVKEAKEEVQEAEDPALRRQATGRKRECKAQQACVVKHEAEEADEAGPVRPSKRRRIGPSSESLRTTPEESQAATDASPAGSETAAPECPVLTRRFLRFRGLERQSGVKNISWERQARSWRVSFQNQKAGKRKQLNFNFPISKHMKEGLAEDEAVAAALAEAKAHREELVRQGKLKPPKPATSTVRGVRRTPAGTFHVEIRNPRTKKQKYGGSFETLAEAEAKARKLAKKLGLHEEVVPVEPLSDLPRFEPLGPEKVTWQLLSQAWYARCFFNGKNRRKTFRPKDLSEKEVEKAWKRAVAWRKRQEQERKQTKRARKR